MLFRLQGKLKAFCNAGREPPRATTLQNSPWQDGLGNGKGHTNVVS